MSTKFIHLRMFDYVITPTLEVAELINPMGGATVAYDITGDSVQYALVRCHSDERYIKKEGRNRSQGRLQSGRPEFVHSLAIDRNGSGTVADQIVNELFVKKLIK